MRPIGRKKIEEIRERLAEKGLEAALFVNHEPVLDSNIAYLSGFSGMLNGALILTRDHVKLITTELDYERAEEEARVDELFRCKHSTHLYTAIRNHCKKYKKMGVVKNKFTVEMAERAGMKPACMVDIRFVMERGRMVKEPKEIDTIRKCAGICNNGVKFLEGFLREGVRENEVAAELERTLKITGSEFPPFETIVSSGDRGFFVHPNPPASDKTVGPGFGLVDFGAVHKDYSSDITVPFIIGKPDDKQERMIGTVFGVWDEIRKMIKAGVQTATLQGIYEKRLQAAGYKVKHSLGHSVGLEVHEYPSLSDSDVELREGMVLAVEPGVYVKNLGGCRLENMVLVKKSGCELLTKSKLIRL